MADKYLCLGCGEVYKDWADLELICPKSSCNEHIIELDELMIPAIWRLNNYGFYTDYCCSGHMYSGNPSFGAYIMFTSEGWKNLTIANPDIELPSSWYIDAQSPYNTIRNVEPSTKKQWTEQDRYRYWLNFMNDITQWAYDLRPLF